MIFTNTATRLLLGISPALAASVCIAVSGGGYTDAHALTSPTNNYYVVGGDSLCAPAGGFAVTGVDPSSGSFMGGYRVTLLGSGFDATTQVKVGDFYAMNVVVVNATTLTFMMMPGRPGASTITLVKGAQTATASFTYLDPGPIAGSVQITSPAQGAEIRAGSALTVTGVGVGGFTIASAFVDSAIARASTDLDPGPGFSTTLNIPATTVGTLTLTLTAMDAAHNLKDATVTVNVTVPPAVTLQHLEAQAVTLIHQTPKVAIHVNGVFSDVVRDLTHAPGIGYQMGAADASVATVDANGVVTPKGVGKTVCHVTYLDKQVDVVVTVHSIRPLLTIQGASIAIPFQGPGVKYDLVPGLLSALRSSGGNYTTAVSWSSCKFTNPSTTDATNPPTNDGFFYLMRTDYEKSFEESPFWSTRSQVGNRTTEITTCP